VEVGSSTPMRPKRAWPGGSEQHRDSQEPRSRLRPGAGERQYPKRRTAYGTNVLIEQNHVHDHRLPQPLHLR